MQFSPCWKMTFLVVILLIAAFGVNKGDYIKGNKKVTWSGSEQWCLDNHHRHMASIHDVYENAEAETACDGAPNGGSDYDICWFGAGRTNSPWTWTDGSDWGYTAWKNNRQRKRHCGYLLDGQWFGVILAGCSLDSLTHYPLCGDVCAPTMSGFLIGGLDGTWERVDGVKSGGQPVFTETACVHGTCSPVYLWLETDYSPSSAWVIGQDHGVNSWYLMKWGDDLFDGAPWRYQKSPGNWKKLSGNQELRCSASTDSVNSELRSSGTSDGLSVSITNAVDTSDSQPDDGSDTVSPLPTNDSPGHFVKIMFGASIGAVILVAAVIVVLLKRSRNKAKPDEVHHVAQQPSTDIVEAVSSTKPAETQCTDTVPQDGTDAMEVVVEEAAPKETEAVSAEQ